MKVLRVRHDTHYTVIRNQTLRDSRLSFKARGLLAYLLSLPDQATVNREDLARYTTEGEYSIRTALRELVRAGYIEHERIRGERGRWITETIVRERPAAEGRKPTFGPRLTTVDQPPWITAQSKRSNGNEVTKASPPPATPATTHEGPNCACGNPALVSDGIDDLCLCCYEAGQVPQTTGTSQP